MSQKETRIWELLAKKVCGEANADELSELSLLLGSENNAHIKSILHILEGYWEKLRSMPESESMQNKSEIFLNKVSLEIHSDNPFEQLETYAKPSFFRRKRWKAAAAVIILLAGSAVFLKNREGRQLTEIASENNAHKQLVLPDGTKVWLNAGSRISYSKKYLQSDKREISLNGEAYFEVKHDATHPFIIHTYYGIDVEDLGTTFNVKAYPKDNSMETTLINGSVEIYGEHTSEQKLLLKPKQKFVYITNKNTRAKSDSLYMLPGSNAVSAGTLGNDKFAIVNVDQVLNKEGDSLASETAWVQNQLAFVSEPFSQLAGRMETRYNIKIAIKDSAIAAYKFTGVFEDESVTEALDELQLIRAFRYTKNSDGNIQIEQ